MIRESYYTTEMSLKSHGKPNWCVGLWCEVPEYKGYHCHNYAVLDIEALVERFGNNVKWATVLKKLKCSKCGEIGGKVAISFVGKGTGAR